MVTNIIGFFYIDCIVAENFRTEMATKNVGEAIDAFGGAELLEAVFNTLNPVEGAEWIFTEFSIDRVVDTAVSALSKKLGIDSSDNDLLQTTIAVMCYVTASEFAQHALGIGSGLSKMDFTG